MKDLLTVTILCVFVAAVHASESEESSRQKYVSFMPVHNDLLIEQGVHIGELHHLEELARERIYEFTDFCTTNKIRGTVAGFALRPIAIF